MPVTVATNLADMATQTLLSGRLAATATEMIVNGLDPDTVYDGTVLFVAALDAGVGWQSRVTPGGAWAAGASDYNTQIFAGFGSSSSIVATNTAHGQMGTIDAGSVAVPALVRFTLYTGSASRQAMVNASAGYITTDGVSIVTGSLLSRRVANGAIADIRFMATATNALAAGSRVFLRRLG